MKYTLVIAAVASLTAAQLTGLDRFPSCGLTCLTSNIASTGCQITDFKCSCENQGFIDKSTGCILSSCEQAEQEKSLAAAKVLCAGVGVEINPPIPEATTQEEPAPTKTPEPTEAPKPPATESEPASTEFSPAPSSSKAPSSGHEMPSATSNGTYTPPVETQAPSSGARRASAAFSLVGLVLLAAIAF